MGDFFQLLFFVVAGVGLLWFGFTIVSRYLAKARLARASRPVPKGDPKDPQSCPICSAKLKRGQLVQTMAFPSITGGKDRLMHIRGCAYCVDGAVERRCPVCGAELSVADILVARIFERPGRRAHVHIVGCNKCRKVGRL